MTTLRQAAENAIEMLEHFQNVTRVGSHDSNAWNHFHRERFMRADTLADNTIVALRATLAAEQGEPKKLWLWRNFVDGRPEYWAFDNPFPINLDNHDPQTLGEPCGYALVKPSRTGRTDVSEETVLKNVKAALAQANQPQAQPGWKPIETAPKDGRKIIVAYINRANKPRTVMAQWVTDEEAAESDADDLGIEGGWYECIDNWDDYSQVAINEGEPSHWMPLPAAPNTQEAK